MKEIEARVLGTVHGVNYRSFVEKKASALWISGYVENTPDYTVTVVAQGPEEKLKTLIKYLWTGPFTSRVSNVEVIWREPTNVFNAFTIRY